MHSHAHIVNEGVSVFLPPESYGVLYGFENGDEGMMSIPSKGGAFPPPKSRKSLREAAFNVDSTYIAAAPTESASSISEGPAIFRMRKLFDPLKDTTSPA
jgi:hypothetical protein